MLDDTGNRERERPPSALERLRAPTQASRRRSIGPTTVTAAAVAAVGKAATLAHPAHGTQNGRTDAATNLAPQNGIAALGTSSVGGAGLLGPLSQPAYRPPSAAAGRPSTALGAELRVRPRSSSAQANFHITTAQIAKAIICGEPVQLGQHVEPAVGELLSKVHVHFKGSSTGDANGYPFEFAHAQTSMGVPYGVLSDFEHQKKYFINGIAKGMMSGPASGSAVGTSDGFEVNFAQPSANTTKTLAAIGPSGSGKSTLMFGPFFGAGRNLLRSDELSNILHGSLYMQLGKAFLEAKKDHPNHWHLFISAVTGLPPTSSAAAAKQTAVSKGVVDLFALKRGGHAATPVNATDRNLKKGYINSVLHHHVVRSEHDLQEVREEIVLGLPKGDNGLNTLSSRSGGCIFFTYVYGAESDFVLDQNNIKARTERPVYTFKRCLIDLPGFESTTAAQRVGEVTKFSSVNQILAKFAEGLKDIPQALRLLERGQPGDERAPTSLQDSPMARIIFDNLVAGGELLFVVTVDNDEENVRRVRQALKLALAVPLGSTALLTYAPKIAARHPASQPAPMAAEAVHKYKQPQQQPAHSSIRAVHPYRSASTLEARHSPRTSPAALDVFEDCQDPTSLPYDPRSRHHPSPMPVAHAHGPDIPRAPSSNRQERPNSASLDHSRAMPVNFRAANDSGTVSIPIRLLHSLCGQLGQLHAFLEPAALMDSEQAALPRVPPLQADTAYGGPMNLHVHHLENPYGNLVQRDERAPSRETRQPTYSISPTSSTASIRNFSSPVTENDVLFQRLQQHAQPQFQYSREQDLDSAAGYRRSINLGASGSPQARQYPHAREYSPVEHDYGYGNDSASRMARAAVSQSPEAHHGGDRSARFNARPTFDLTPPTPYQRV